MRLRHAGQKALTQQLTAVSPPKRIVADIDVIWTLQARMTSGKREDALMALEHPRFRAALDFLLLRAKAGDKRVFELAAQWDEMSQANDEQLKALLLAMPERGRQRK